MTWAPWLFIIHCRFWFSLVKFISGRLENSKKKTRCPKIMQFSEEHRLVGSAAPSILFQVNCGSCRAQLPPVEVSAYLFLSKVLSSIPLSWLASASSSFIPLRFSYYSIPLLPFSEWWTGNEAFCYLTHRLIVTLSFYGIETVNPFSEDSWEHLNPQP